MNLNERIAKIIEYSAYSSSEFADAVEVQRSSISHITSGRNKPSLDFLVKVKDRFPELQWDWLITGDGEMLKSTEQPEVFAADAEKPKTTSLPDLFTLIEDDYLGSTESEDRIQKKVTGHIETEERRESNKTEQAPAKDFTTDSQRLGAQENAGQPQPAHNQENKVTRIVLFYENGKFESFEP